MPPGLPNRAAAPAPSRQPSRPRYPLGQARFRQLPQAGAHYRQSLRSIIAGHPVASPLVADAVRRVHVAVVQRAAAPAHRNYLVHLEAPRVPGRQAVVDGLAADVARPPLGPEPRPELPACVAVPVARVSHDHHLRAHCGPGMRRGRGIWLPRPPSCLLFLRAPPSGGLTPRRSRRSAGRSPPCASAPPRPGCCRSRPPPRR